MDIPEKTKDNVKAIVDQAKLYDRPKLNMAPPASGKSWAYAMAHMGSASSDMRYDPAVGPQAYSNPSVHERLISYSEVGKEVHRAEWDPAA